MYIIIPTQSLQLHTCTLPPYNTHTADRFSGAGTVTASTLPPYNTHTADGAVTASTLPPYNTHTADGAVSASTLPPYNTHTADRFSGAGAVSASLVSVLLCTLLAKLLIF